MLPGRKAFAWGLAAGVVLTLVSLDLWGVRLERSIVSNAQPTLLAPAAAIGFLPGQSLSSMKLQKPSFLPEISGSAHENWSVRSLDGRSVKMSDMKGTVVFLNFWSTTCAPCIAEMPEIARLAESLKSERVVFMAVTQDDEPQVRQFLKTHAFGIPVFLAGRERPEDLSAMGVPATYILDTGNAIVYGEVGAQDGNGDEARGLLRKLVERAAVGGS
jgi:thiol-disulfide isomerase/thioredoxin